MESGSFPSSDSPNNFALCGWPERYGTSQKQIPSGDDLASYSHRPITASPNSFTTEQSADIQISSLVGFYSL
jgi:hypothetical protein